MRLASRVFSRRETAAEDGMYADGIKIIGGHDASDGALSAVTKAERGASDFGDDEGVDEGAAFLQVEQVGPGDTGVAGFAARGSGNGRQSFLVRDQRIGAEEDSFDP